MYSFYFMLMKNYLFITFALILFTCFELYAQNEKLDTIYIRTNIEDISSKFLSNFENQNRVSFFFKIEWQLHGRKRDDIYFYYLSPKKSGINEWSTFIKDEKDFINSRKYYTLNQFTKKLENQVFFTFIFNGKAQIIILYGSKCSNKVEIYPVKLGTDISNEG